MMELTSSAKNIKLKNADELFYTDEIREDLKKDKVEKLPITELFSFKNHPFKVSDDEKMLETVESVKQNGVLVPIIVRERKEGGGYEIVSGHRRKRACELADIHEIPAIIKDLTDDEAVIIMVDSNLQRETVLPSEKAFAYKMKLEAMKRQAGRPKNNSTQVVSDLRTNEQLGKDVGESRENIRRYIRLTNLTPNFLEMVDSKKMAFNPAVEISYLSEKMQAELYDVMDMEQATPSLSQAQRIKQFSNDGKLSREVLEAIMSEEKPQSVEWNVKPDKIKDYFPKNTKPQEMERVIFKLLDNYRQKQRNKEAMER